MNITLNEKATAQGHIETLLNPSFNKFDRQGAAYDLLTNQPDTLSRLAQGERKIPHDVPEIIGAAFRECGTARENGHISEQAFNQAFSTFIQITQGAAQYTR